ncbi:MAG TPA: SHOCT domain-containing protein [Microlunatus sp.]
MNFNLLDFIWSMLWFTLFFVWVWLMIMVFSDIFRSHDLKGWAKALWTIFVVVVPYLGVLVYLIARGHKMTEHGRQRALDQEQRSREYIQTVAGSDGTAAEIERLAALRESGAITEEEFQQGKSKVLG